MLQDHISRIDPDMDLTTSLPAAESIGGALALAVCCTSGWKLLSQWGGRAALLPIPFGWGQGLNDALKQRLHRFSRWRALLLLSLMWLTILCSASEVQQLPAGSFLYFLFPVFGTDEVKMGMCYYDSWRHSWTAIKREESFKVIRDLPFS